ncbi:MAG: hypothetical protein RX318_03760 [bacterium]|nr:hypothetical protein [bacterium]
MGQETTTESLEAKISELNNLLRLCRCGCGEAIRDGSRPTKLYLNRWHKDRARSARERAAQRALGEIGDLKALWVAWGRQMGWLE